MRAVSNREHFINRELSWLEFKSSACWTRRWTQPIRLLERLKFFTIVSSNLDECFEVRVAGLRKQEMESGKGERSMDGLTARGRTFRRLRTDRVRRMVTDHHDSLAR